MLYRQKELLNAQFARGNLEIHKKVVSLYLLNLVTVVMYSMVALAQFIYGLRSIPNFIENRPLISWPYIITSMLGIYSSLTTSLLAVTMYTYGHANFLQSEDHKKTIGTVRKMKLMQEQSAKWAMCIFLFIVMQKWIPIFGNGISNIFAVIQSMIFIIGSYMAYIHGKRTITLFSEHSRDPVDVRALIDKYSHTASMATSRLQILDGALSERTDTRISTGDLSDPVGGGGDAATLPRSVSEVRGTGGGAETLLSQVASAVSGNSAHAVSMLAFVLDEEEGRHHRDVESAMAAKELKRTLRQKMRSVKARGVLWNKSLRLESGTFQPLSYFVKTYAVMERGTLHFYLSKEQFLDLEDTIDHCPIYLKNYEVVTESKVILKHDRNYESVSSYLRTALIGTSEMLLSDAVGADFDVELATKRFKFALVPKDFSELGNLEPIILMAEDEEAYHLWVAVFREIIEGYRLLHSFKRDVKELDLIRDAKTAVAMVHYRQQEHVRVKVPSVTDLSKIL